jgi:hypothetical protein
MTVGHDAERSLLRRATASRLRRVADRMDPRPRRLPAGVAPLVRFGGRWWKRDALLARGDELD